jgi:hypothetical protein
MAQMKVAERARQEEREHRLQVSASHADPRAHPDHQHEACIPDLNGPELAEKDWSTFSRDEDQPVRLD